MLSNRHHITMVEENMTIQTEIKAWLDDLGFKYKFSEFEEMFREVEMIGADGMVNEYSYQTHEINNEAKDRLKKTIFGIYWVSESWEDDPSVALEWLALSFDEFFAVKNSREKYGFSYKNIYEFVNLASWLARQDGTCLSYDATEGYIYTRKIANFLSCEGENLTGGILASKRVRDLGCDCVFDLYGDENTTLAFVGGLLCISSDKNQTLPTVDHIVEELRSCSATRLEHLEWDEIIYQKMKNGDSQGVCLWETIFDLSAWEGNGEKLMLFEEAVNKVLQENIASQKSKFLKPLPERFCIFDLHDFYEKLKKR